MNQVTVYMDPVGCAQIGWTQAAGMPGDTRFNFKTPTNAPYPGTAALNPQLILRPYTVFYVNAYDIVVDDPVGASGFATIPGSAMNDRFQLEVYQRDSTGAPQKMIAYGKVDISGISYGRLTPLGPATFSVGPSGPAGPAGATGAPGPAGQPGMRGSRWYTGAGVPTGSVPDDRVDGDMYLDTTNGDVWRWAAATTMWVPFKGTSDVG